MDAAEMMYRILSNSCANPSSNYPGFLEYRIELCCKELIVTAKPLGDFDIEQGFGRYDILTYREVYYAIPALVR